MSTFSNVVHVCKLVFHSDNLGWHPHYHKFSSSENSGFYVICHHFQCYNHLSGSNNVIETHKSKNKIKKLPYIRCTMANIYVSNVFYLPLSRKPTQTWNLRTHHHTSYPYIHSYGLPLHTFIWFTPTYIHMVYYEAFSLFLDIKFHK